MRVKEESEKAGLKVSFRKTKIMASGPITSWQIEGERVGAKTDFIFFGSIINADGDCGHEIRRCLLLRKKAMTNLDHVFKKQRCHFAHKDPHSRSYGFSSSHLWMWELDHKEGWTLKNWCFWIVVLDKTLESPLDCKEIKPVKPKGNQSLILIGKTNAKAPILWQPNAKNWLIGRDPDAGKDWRQMEKSVTADWGDWMASLNQWTWIRANSRRWRWWKTGTPDMLKSMGSQRVRRDLATEQQQQDVRLPTLSLRTGMHRIVLSKEIFFMSFLWPIDISALCKRLWAVRVLMTVSIVSLHCLLRMYHLLYLGSLAETSISIFFHLYSKT